MHLKVGNILLSTALDEASLQILNSVKSASSTVIDLIKGIFDYAVIPIGALSIAGVIIFLLMNVAKSKRSRDGEDLQEHIKNLIIAIVVEVLVVGYGSIAWGWIKI